MRLRFPLALSVVFIGCASEPDAAASSALDADARGTADACSDCAAQDASNDNETATDDVWSSPDDALAGDDTGSPPDAAAQDTLDPDTAAQDTLDPDTAAPDTAAQDTAAPDPEDTTAGDTTASDPDDVSPADDVDPGPSDVDSPGDDASADVGGGEAPEPVVASPGEPTVASAQLLGTGVVQATVVGDALAVVGEAGATWIGSGPSAVVAPELTSAVAGGALDATHAFVADSNAAWVVDASAAQVSPIADALGGDISGVAVRPGASPTIWLAAQAKLWRWRDAQLVPLLTPGYDFSEARLTLDDSTLWAASPFGVYRVTETPGGADVTAERPDLDAAAVAVDSEGAVGVVDATGDLHLRGPEGWKAWRFSAPAQAVCGNWIAGRLFVVLTDGQVWFVSGADRWPIATAGSGFSDCVVDASGRGVTFGPGGVTRWAVNAPIDVGPPEVTWTTDVGPLISARCSKCHGPSGYAHPLNSYDQAKNEIDSLLIMVSSGAMPLPPNAPLSAAEVALIQAWKSGGFLK